MSIFEPLCKKNGWLTNSTAEQTVECAVIPCLSEKVPFETQNIKQRTTDYL